MDPVVGSIIVAVILLAVIILIIHKLVSDKKKGKFSCGGCVGCRLSHSYGNRSCR